MVFLHGDGLRKPRNQSTFDDRVSPVTQAELRHLRTAIVAAGCGSFSSAALQLNVEASAVSRTVRELEFHLGTLFFERLPRGVRLTSVGERYVETARDVLAMLDHARVEARSANSGSSGRLAIGNIWSFARGSANSLIAGCGLGSVPQVRSW